MAAEFPTPNLASMRAGGARARPRRPVRLGVRRDSAQNHAAGAVRHAALGSHNHCARRRRPAPGQRSADRGRDVPRSGQRSLDQRPTSATAIRNRVTSAPIDGSSRKRSPISRVIRTRRVAEVTSIAPFAARCDASARALGESLGTQGFLHNRHHRAVLDGRAATRLPDRRRYPPVCGLLHPIALHAAIGLVVLFLGALTLRPDTGWMALLSGDRPGAATARMLLPVVVIGPLLLAFLFEAGRNAGLYGSEFRLALTTLATSTAGNQPAVECGARGSPASRPTGGGGGAAAKRGAAATHGRKGLPDHGACRRRRSSASQPSLADLDRLRPRGDRQLSPGRNAPMANARRWCGPTSTGSTRSTGQ